MSLAERLAEAMKARRLSKNRAAGMVGVSAPTLRAWLSGADPQLSRYKQLVAAFPEVGEDFTKTES